ncbi:MAG: CopG family transcriptional regulator [Dehalococcoidia bacterium]
MKMVRKQVYLTVDDDAKVKQIARQRRCTEAQVIREAIGTLPSAEDPGLAAVRAAGLLLEPEGPPASEAELAEAEREWEEWLAAHPAPLRLSEAVIEEREERDAFLAGHLGAGQALPS